MFTIKRELKELGISFNEDAVVILSKREIPSYVKVVAALGASYNFCEPIGTSSEVDVLITMDKILSRCDSFNDRFFARHDFSAVKASLFGVSSSSPVSAERGHTSTRQQTYVCELAKKTRTFLDRSVNRDIVVLSSDKGGKTVIMDREDYVRKANAHISENVAAHNYAIVSEDFFTVVRPRVECRYSDVIREINPYLMLDGAITKPLLSESYLLPLFYGCPKINKPNVPLRPIIASKNMIGDFLSTWLLQKLKLVADSLSQYNVHSALEIVPDLKRFRLEDRHVLSTLDYVSMFTNVNVAETVDIIGELYHYISPTTAVPLSVFLVCLRFFTSDAAYFGFDGILYLQGMGLAMGNRLAQVLAEIRTNHALLLVVKRFDASVISLLYKYVDDVFISIHADVQQFVMDAISLAVGMKITVTHEDENKEVEFLDCVFRRNDDGSISTRWFKKECSSRMVLNYHSLHPWMMKRNVVDQMIKRALALTSSKFVPAVTAMLVDVLRRSSYPVPFVNSAIRLIKNNMHGTPSVAACAMPSVQTSTYVSCPYVQPSFDAIKSTIANVGIPVKLAPTPVSRNKNVIFSRLKDSVPQHAKKNVLFRMSCSMCSFFHDAVADTVDVGRTMTRCLENVNAPVAKHLVSYPGHVFMERPVVIRSFRNGFDARVSMNVATDIVRALPPGHMRDG